MVLLVIVVIQPHLTVMVRHLEQLQKESGFPNHWKSQGFECSEKSLRETVNSQLVYLTSDSNNVLEQLSDDTVYVIGGIVDRNR
jgi:tRNA (guanine9-N1)-methyltransferase